MQQIQKPPSNNLPSQRERRPFFKAASAVLAAGIIGLEATRAYGVQFVSTGEHKFDISTLEEFGLTVRVGLPIAGIIALGIAVGLLSKAISDGKIFRKPKNDNAQGD